MSTTQTQLFPPPTRSNVTDAKGMLAATFRQWLFTLQYLLPLVEVDTTSGDASFTLPPAGLNSTTGQSNQNQEIIYVKTSADAHTATITGAETGAIILRKQWDSARFKSDGTNWVNSGVGSSGGPASANFALLTSGENEQAAMVVGTGASLDVDGEGTINANKLVGLNVEAGDALTEAGKVPVSDGAGNLVLGDPFVQGVYDPDTNCDTGGIAGGPIKPVLVGARNTADGKLKDVACDADGNLGVNIEASALPTGAATAANQTSEISELTAIAASLAGTLDVDVTASVLPANAAQETGGNLAAIKTDLDLILANQTNGTQVISRPIPVPSTVSNSPSAGVEVLLTIPAGTYRLSNLTFRLDTDATVANRVPYFIVHDSAGNIIYDIRSRFNQPASAPVVYQLIASSIFDNVIPDSEVAILPIPPYLLLTGGATIETSTIGLQSGDQWVEAIAFLESVV